MANIFLQHTRCLHDLVELPTAPDTTMLQAVKEDDADIDYTELLHNHKLLPGVLAALLVIIVIISVAIF